MHAELIINSRPYETRVALVENGMVVELHVERRSGQELMGNIYKGRVVRVLPGMQAAFVDIGLDRTAFLYVSDVKRELLDLEEMMLASQGEQEEADYLGAGAKIESIPLGIEDMLREGQDIMVQVAKEPVTKAQG